MRKIQKISRLARKLAINWTVSFVYYYFNKIKYFFYFILKVVTIGTKVILVVYQHLFAQNCIFEEDTIGYKRYNYSKS